MSGPGAALKTALKANGMARATELVALGQKRAMRLPMVGLKVWDEAIEQTSGELITSKRKPGRPPSPEGKTVQINVRVTKDQRDTFYRIGGAGWLRGELDRKAKM